MIANEITLFNILHDIEVNKLYVSKVQLSTIKTKTTKSAIKAIDKI